MFVDTVSFWQLSAAGVHHPSQPTSIYSSPARTSATATAAADHAAVANDRRHGAIRDDNAAWHRTSERPSASRSADADILYAGAGSNKRTVSDGAMPDDRWYR